jgi:hypothetical protein
MKHHHHGHQFLLAYPTATQREGTQRTSSKTLRLQRLDTARQGVQQSVSSQQQLFGRR